MLDERILQSFLNDPTLLESRQGLETALDRELDKPEAEMDTDFIAEATRMLLEMQNRPIETELEQRSSFAERQRLMALPPRKKGGLWKFSLIAAVVCLISVLSVATVSAAVFKVDVFSNFVQVYKDHILINFGSNKQPSLPSNPSAKLEKVLRMNGFDNVLLPSEFNEEYIVEDIVYDCSMKGRQTADLFLHKGNKAVTISITQYDRPGCMESVNINDEAIQVKEVECNGLSVFVVNMKEHVDLVYAYDRISYYIVTQYDWEKAVEIAHSIEAA